MASSSQVDPQSFDACAEIYAELAALERDSNFFLERLPTRRGRALDLGCGSGLLARALAAHFDEVVAVDLSPAMLAIAARDNPSPNVAYVRADANALALEGRFDLIASHTTFHHLADAGRSAAALRGLCAPGGRIALVDCVSPRGSVPRWNFLVGALLALPGDALRRGPALGYRLARLRTSRTWLDHLASDRYLTPERFREVYGNALPGARFEPAGPFAGVLWDAPG